MALNVWPSVAEAGDADIDHARKTVAEGREDGGGDTERRHRGGGDEERRALGPADAHWRGAKAAAASTTAETKRHVAVQLRTASSAAPSAVIA